GMRARLMTWASFEQRYRTAAVISSGVVQRAFSDVGCQSRSCFASMVLTNKMLAVTPELAVSLAAVSMRASCAALAAAYGAIFAGGLEASGEETTMIRPQRFSTRCGTNAWAR